MKLISFDIGIKNLSYCILESETKRILDWGIIDISVDPKCSHCSKGKQCDKSATYQSDDKLFCTGHSKLKCYEIYKKKKIKKSVNHIFDLGKNMVSVLDKTPHFLDVNLVLLENQPALKNPTMKTVQMLLYSYFLMRGVSDGEIENIVMVNARNKLKAYKGDKIECDFKDKYKKNKYLAVEYCKKMVEDQELKFVELFTNSKKKDDLSDSYLQGIYYIQDIINA